MQLNKGKKRTSLKTKLLTCELHDNIFDKYLLMLIRIAFGRIKWVLLKVKDPRFAKVNNKIK